MRKLKKNIKPIVEDGVTLWRSTAFMAKKRSSGWHLKIELVRPGLLGVISLALPVIFALVSYLVPGRYKVWSAWRPPHVPTNRVGIIQWRSRICRRSVGYLPIIREYWMEDILLRPWHLVTGPCLFTEPPRKFGTMEKCRDIAVDPSLPVRPSAPYCLIDPSVEFPEIYSF